MLHHGISRSENLKFSTAFSDLFIPFYLMNSSLLIPRSGEFHVLYFFLRIPPQLARTLGFSVAELPGDRVLHFVTLKGKKDVDELWSDFDSILLMKNPDVVDEFCRVKGNLRFSKLDLSDHRENKHGVDVVNDFEFVFLGRLCEEFLDSLIFYETYTEAVNAEAFGF